MGDTIFPGKTTLLTSCWGQAKHGVKTAVTGNGQPQTLSSRSEGSVVRS